METYYEEIIKEVQLLIEKKDYKEAYAILSDELKMPYIPLECEAKLIELYNVCRSICELNRSEKAYSEEDLEELFQGTLEMQFQAVEICKNCNLRNHLEVVEHYLNDEPHYLIKSMLIDALIEQQIHDEIRLQHDGLEITFIPYYIDPPMEADGALETLAYLREWFENDNPSFLSMCVDTLVKESYLKLPFNVEEDESCMLALAIVEYVFSANGEKEMFQSWLESKELAFHEGYELLLNKHDI